MAPDALIPARISSSATSERTKIRVLHVITGLTTGGAEMMLVKLLSATRGRYSHAVVSLKNEGAVAALVQDLGVPVYCLGLRPLVPNPRRILWMRSIVRQFQPQIIQGWMYHGNLMAGLAGKFSQTPVPVLWNVRQSLEDIAAYKWETALIIRLGALFSRYPRAIIYNSRSGAKHHQIFGYREAKQIVIPNGFDCDIFRPDESARRQIREELGVSSEEVLVGLIARYDSLKDHHGFLLAAARVTETHNHVRFLLAGKGVTADQRKIKDQIAREGLQERVFLLGERFDINRVTCALDVACSSSRTEGFSNAVGEAMACGVPCVVTDVGDSAYMVGDAGLVVPPRDPAAMAQGIKKFIDGGPEFRRRLGVAARRRVENEFSLSAIAGRYDELYRELVPELSIAL